MDLQNNSQLTIEDALALPSFSSAHVLSGREGILREITGAMIVEAPDIEHWGKRGLLIITSYFALYNLSDAELSAFFEKIDTIGVSGIVFKLKRLVASVPAPIVSLCDKFGIPLIVVPNDTKYENILLDIMGHIINSNMTLLNRFYEVHKSTMALVLKRPSLLQILTNLKGIIGSDCTFLNEATMEKVSTKAKVGEPSKLELEELASSTYQAYSYYRAVVEYAQGPATSALAANIPSPNASERYYLIVHRDPDELSMLDIMAIENIVSLLQMEILKTDAIDRKLFIQNNNTMHDLLLDRYGSHSKIEEALASLGIGTFDSYELLLVKTSLVDGTSQSQLDEVLSHIKTRFRAAYLNLAYYMTNDRILLLHNFDSARDRFSLERIQSILAKIHTDASIPDFVHLAAISRTCDRWHISSINSEVMDIHKLFSNSQWQNRCISYENLGIYKLFLHVDNIDTLTECIDSRILQLHRENPELLETLIVLCENNLNFQETAKQMILHPKTIHYRVNRAQEIVGLDVRDAEDCVQILLSSKMLSLVDSRPKLPTHRESRDN